METWTTFKRVVKVFSKSFGETRAKEQRQRLAKLSRDFEDAESFGEKQAIKEQLAALNDYQVDGAAFEQASNRMKLETVRLPFSVPSAFPNVRKLKFHLSPCLMGLCPRIPRSFVLLSHHFGVQSLVMELLLLPPLVQSGTLKKRR